MTGKIFSIVQHCELRSIRIAFMVIGVFVTVCVAADPAEQDASIEAAEAQVAQLLERFTERHPDVIRARRKLGDLRAKAAARQAQAVAVEGVTPVSEAEATPATAAIPQRPPRALAREQRRISYVERFADLCARQDVLACFDFDGDTPLASHTNELAGVLAPSSDGRVRARIYNGAETGSGNAVRMDFQAADAADHGSFVFTLDAFGEGDRLVVQWRQWFSPELVTRFTSDRASILPRLGGGGAKQLGISEIGDPQGCSFGEIVAGNAYWNGAVSLYHGCGLWYRPHISAPAGASDPSDFDFQPGGDNVCRYRYSWNNLKPGIDYLYPTKPSNLLEVPGLAAVVHPERYHGCMGWVADQWITFRLEIDIAYCRSPWSEPEIPAACRSSAGRLRYWLKYADEEKPWLVIDQAMPLRWKAGHSERYARFMFLPYNTGETARADKPHAFTLYDDIVVARNSTDLPWLRH